MVTDCQEDYLQIKTRLQRWPVQDTRPCPGGAETQPVPGWPQPSPRRPGTCADLWQWKRPESQLQLHRARGEILAWRPNLPGSSDVQDTSDLPLTTGLSRWSPSLSIAKAGRSPTIRQWFLCDQSNLVKHCQTQGLSTVGQEKPRDDEDKSRFSKIEKHEKSVENITAIWKI